MRKSDMEKEFQFIKEAVMRLIEFTGYDKHLIKEIEKDIVSFNKIKKQKKASTVKKKVNK